MKVTPTSVILFDFKTLTKTGKIVHTMRPISDNFGALIITQDNRLFIAGSLNHPFTLTYEFDFVAQEMLQKASLNNPKWSGSLVEIKKDLLLIVGGYSSFCEVYNVKQNTWRTISPLNHERWSAACFCYDEKYVYAYGGYITTSLCDKPLLSIEMLEVDEGLSNPWKVLDVKIPKVDFPCASLTCFQINDREILILGEGDHSLKPTTETIIFDLGTDQIRLSNMKLAISDSFSGSSPAFSYKKEKSSIHYVISKRGSLHILKGEKWICIEGFAADNQIAN